MRFYVHFETAALGELPGGEATLIVEQGSAPTTTVAELRDAMLHRYDSSHPGAGVPLAQRGGSLAKSGGSVLLDPSAKIQALVKSGDDVWVVRDRSAPPVTPAVDESCEPQIEESIEEPIEEFSTEGAREVERERAASASKAAAASDPKPAPQVRSNPYEEALGERAKGKLTKLLQDSAAALEQRNYRTAQQLHAQVFAIDRTNAQARREAAVIDRANQDPDAAEAHIGIALSARPKPTDPLLFVELGDVYREQHEFEDAVDAYRSALKHAKQHEKYRNDATWTNDVKILMARAYLALNPREATDANNLIREVLGSDPNHRHGILFYGEVMLQRQNVVEALPMYLRLVAHSMGEDKAIKKPLAQLLDMPGAVEELEAKLPPTSKAGADIYGYLGGLAKDRSKLAVATRLYRTAIEMEGRRPTYLLNHMHTLELSWNYTEAFMDAVDWLRAKVSSHPDDGVGDIRTSTVLDVLDSHSFQCSVDPSLRSEGCEVAYVDFSDPAGISTENESKVGANGKKEFSAKSDTLDREGLDLLAVFFTLCKISFVAGELEVLPPLIRILEVEHRERDLHLTVIKNEAAYFGCIKQLTGLLPYPPAEYDAELPPLFIVGDSHCLTAAWRVITYRGRRRILRPMLVTGLKCWHMRDGEDFYPRTNFDNVCAKIPTGSEVIFLFGEIDCREGILVAVERLKYRDLAEGIDVAQNHYLKMLKALQRKREFQIFVHPVPLVMDITRSTCLEWNKRMEAKLRVVPSIAWLDFADELMTEDGKLHKRYELDGIHMHPEYIPLLEASLGSEMLGVDD